MAFDPNSIQIGDNASDLAYDVRAALADLDTTGGTFTPAGTGAVARTTQDKLREQVSVKDFGAVGDGVTNDAPAFRAVIAKVKAAGGGKVIIPPGNYLLTTRDPAGGFYAVLVDGVTNLALEGSGVGTTTITCLHASGVGSFSFQGCDGLSVRHLTIDGNRQNQPQLGVHGLAFGSCSRVRLRDIEIVNSCSYGLGFQNDGQYRDVVIDGFTIRDCAVDGIDIKNRDTTNPAANSYLDPTKGNRGFRISNGLIQDWGAQSVTDGQAYAAMDCRGPVTATNIQVVVTQAGRRLYGPRSRVADVSAINANGIGGRFSTFSNIHCVGRGQSGGDDVHIGMVIADQFTMVSNCTITDWDGYGFQAEVGSDGSSFVNCAAVRCHSAGFLVLGNDIRLTSCVSTQNLVEGFRISGALRHTLIGCEAKGNATRGFYEINGAASGTYALCKASANTTTNWSLAAGSTVLQSEGYTGTTQLVNNGSVQAELGATASTVRWFRMDGATTGSPNLSARSSDGTGNLDVVLTPLNNGVLRMNYASNAATTPANFSPSRYIIVKDSAGTAYYLPLAAAPW